MEKLLSSTFLADSTIWAAFPYVGVITVASTLTPPPKSKRRFFDSKNAVIATGKKSSWIWRSNTAELIEVSNILRNYGSFIADMLLDEKLRDRTIRKQEVYNSVSE